VNLGQTKVDYSELIIGLGCEDKYHNVPGAKEYTHSIQTLSKARSLANSMPLKPAPTIPTRAPLGNSLIL
jgi:NADH dehydrogenase